jgi:hypothetical protein
MRGTAPVLNLIYLRPVIVAGFSALLAISFIRCGGGEEGNQQDTNTAAATPTPETFTPEPAVAPDIAARKVVAWLFDGSGCYLATIIPESGIITPISESAGLFTGVGQIQIVSRSLPALYESIFWVEPDDEGSRLLVRGSGGAGSEAFQEWTILDSATRTSTGIEPDSAAPFPYGFHPLANGANGHTRLEFAMWSPAGDGSVIGVFLTDEDTYLEVQGTRYGYRPTRSLFIAKRSNTGVWSAPSFSRTMADVGLNPPDAPGIADVNRSTLHIHQAAALPEGQIVMRISGAVVGLPAYGGSVILFDSLGNPVRLYDSTSARFAVDLAEQAIVAESGDSYSIETGQPGQRSELQFGSDTAWSADGQHRLEVLGGTGSNLRIRISERSAKTSQELPVSLPAGSRLCSTDLQISWIE